MKQKKPKYAVQYEAIIKFIPSADCSKSGTVLITDTNGLKAEFKESHMEIWANWFLYRRHD